MTWYWNPNTYIGHIFYFYFLSLHTLSVHWYLEASLMSYLTYGKEQIRGKYWIWQCEPCLSVFSHPGQWQVFIFKANHSDIITFHIEAFFSLRASFDKYEAGNQSTFFWLIYGTGALFTHLLDLACLRTAYFKHLGVTEGIWVNNCYLKMQVDSYVS